MRTGVSVCLAICALLIVSASAFHNAPVFTLDYSKPPVQRWYGAVGTVLKEHSFEASFGPVIADFNNSIASKLSDVQRTTLEAVVSKRYPEHYGEIQGIAADFANNGHPEVNMDILLPYVFYHELAHATDLQLDARVGRECTGVLVLPTDPTKAVIHGRNLDQSVSSGRNMTLQIEAVNGSSKVIYQAVDFYWITSGFVTAQKEGFITLEENWRSADLHPAQTLDQIVARLSNGYTLPQVFMFREVLESVLADETPNSPTAFQRVVSYLNTSTFAAPFYGIVSGPGRQGAVLSISWDSQYNHLYFLGDKSNPDSWFLVQTNYDRWNPDPANDNRRTYAQHALRRLGQEDGATRLGVWMTISEFPVHNQDTFYSLLMSVDHSTRGFIREPMMPVHYEKP